MGFVALKNNPQALEISRRIFFRSSAYALAAYYYSLILEKFLIIAGAVIFGYKTSFYYQGVDVLLDPKAWNQESVLMIYLAPYLIQVILVILLYSNLQKIQVVPGHTMIFIHWVMFFITYRLVGMLPVHLIFKTGIYHAFESLFLGIGAEIIIILAGIVFFFVVDIWMLKGVLYFSATYNNNFRVIGLQNVIRYALLIPIILVCLISCLYFLPDPPKEEIAGLLVMALLSVYTILRLLYGRPEQLPKGEIVIEKSDPKRLFFIILILIILLRILLGIGIAI
jgi:hypothetical protein